MSTPRRRSNGASPLVNPQRQITSFFTKSTSSPSPSPSPVLKSNSSPAAAATPSPLQSKPSPVTPAKLYGEEVVGRRIKVLWPADSAWYKGCVKSFNNKKSSHLILYDDGDEEELNLSNERFEWEAESAGGLKRLRRGLLPTMTITKTPEAKEESVEEEDDDDSDDEDWGKSGEKKAVEEEVEEEDEAVKLEDEEDSEEEEEIVIKTKGKRKSNGGGKSSGSAKKTKTGGGVANNDVDAKLTEPITKANSKTLLS